MLTLLPEIGTLERKQVASLAGSVAKFECIFAFGQFCAILFSKELKAGAIHDD